MLSLSRSLQENFVAGRVTTLFGQRFATRGKDDFRKRIVRGTLPRDTRTYIPLTNLAMVRVYFCGFTVRNGSVRDWLRR